LKNSKPIKKRLRSWTASTLAASALAVSGCGAPDSSGSVMAFVYAPNRGAAGYSLQKAEVANLTSLNGLEGRDISVRRKSSISADIGSQTINRGEPFALDYSVEADGTIVASDLHSLHGLSVYRGLDNIASTLRAHGHVPRQRLDVYYFPRVDSVLLGDVRSGFTDNAAYSPDGPFFLVLPSFLFAQLPLHLNEGILAHEFGHSVVQDVLFGNDIQERGREFDSMNEGVADLIGFSVSGESNFIAASIEVDRDLAKPADYTADDLTELTEGREEFDPHRHGSVMARAVYEMWPKQDGVIGADERGRMLDAVLASLKALQGKGMTWLSDFPVAMVQQLPAEQREGACAVLRSRLSVLLERGSSCNE
jgi:hypothetical protein